MNGWSEAIAAQDRQGPALLVHIGQVSPAEAALLVDRYREGGRDLLLRGERLARVATLLGGPVTGDGPALVVRAGTARGSAFETTQRLLDLFLGGALLVILLPLLAAIALAIRTTSRGPVLYRAEVVGRNGRRFVWRKFRTMREDAAETRHREAAERFIKGADLEFRRTGVFKMQRDDRVTRVGSFLRRHSLDELPQILDVLAGHMSLVGPRPCLPYEWEIYQPHHRRRLEVRPGMTGLWQTRGRSRVDFEEMVLMDRCWAWNRSVGLYLGTLARTLGVVLRGDGGY